jgi:hypothetical protein
MVESAPSSFAASLTSFSSATEPSASRLHMVNECKLFNGIMHACMCRCACHACVRVFMPVCVRKCASARPPL